MKQTRIDLLGMLGVLSHHYPSMRFGQLLEMVATLAGAETAADMERYSDAELLEVAKEHHIRRMSQLIEEFGDFQYEPLASERDQLLAELRGIRRWRHKTLIDGVVLLALEMNTTLYDIEDAALLQRLNPQNAVA